MNKNSKLGILLLPALLVSHLALSNGNDKEKNNKKHDKTTKQLSDAIVNTDEQLEEEKLIQLMGLNESAPSTMESSDSLSTQGFATMAAPPGGGGEPGGGSGALGIANEDILGRIKVEESITPHTTDLLGEQIDLNSGNVSFRQTDLIAKGIGPNIVVSRKFYPESGGMQSFNSSYMHDWFLEIPSIHTTLLYNNIRYSGAWGIGKECSGEINPGPIAKLGTTFDTHEYFNGESLILPGAGQEKIVYNNGRKTASNWKFTCFNRSGGGEGFIGHSPDGLKYTFDKQRLIFSRHLFKDFKTIPMYQGFMLASKIEDRFGNWVKYNYSGSQLTSITSSDGRTVSFTYGSGSLANYITSMSYNNRTWTYSYDSTKGLRTVTRPDGKKWQYDLYAIGIAKPIMGSQYGAMMDDCAYSDDANRAKARATITHPDGVVGIFDFEERIHGRSNTNDLRTTSGGPYVQPQCYGTVSLVEKTLDGPGLSPMKWYYDYSENRGYRTGETIKPYMKITDYPNNLNAHDYKWTQVTAPDGAKTKYYHNRNYASYLDGSLMAIEQFDTNGTTKLSLTRKYLKNQYVGNAGLELSNNQPHSNRILTSKEIIGHFNSGGSDYFTKEYTSHDSYGKPTKTVESNDANGGKKRYMQYTYDYDTTNWIIGRPFQTRISSNGSSFTEVSKTEYHSRTGSYKSLPAKKYSYGRWHTYYNTYHSNGLPRLVKRNATNQWVEYSNYYRGVARTIRTPQSTSTSSQYAYKTVDANGWTLSIKDFNGNTESYTYDKMGKVTYINPADGAFFDTTISYSVSSGGMGVPGTESGMTVQTVSKGNYRKQTYFDGLLRPLAVKEWDNGNSANTLRYTRTNFDYQNKPTYQSRPSTSTSTPYGVVTIYDGMGRTKKVDDNTTGGSIDYYYLNDDRVQVNDNKGNVTTTTYLSYGTPEQSKPTYIASPEGVSTSLAYDIFGNVSHIQQGGEYEYRVYDSYKQLCKIIREDVGRRAYQYDAVGQLLWEGFGGKVSTDKNSCTTTVGDNEKTTYTYDNRGQVKTVTFGDGRSNKTYYYDRNGNLTQLNAGSVISNYSYNSQNLVKSEQLRIDGKTFTLNYTFDGLGNVASIKYPSGSTVSTTHNALGQQTRIGNYATNAKYHALGALKSHSYGNGFAYSSTLNNAGLPSYTHDVKGSSYALKYALYYDSNNNLTRWDDQVNSSYDLSLTYDRLDRLDQITDSYAGTGNIDYDTLGNITKYTLGGSTNYYNYNSYKQLAYIYGRDSYSFGYDSRGNVTSNGKDSFSYNVAGQLYAASGNSYIYDGHNRRVKKSDGNGTSYSMYSLGGQLMYRQVGGAHKDYYRLGNKLVATKKGSTVEYVHADYLGSPAAYSNTSGSILRRAHSHPFGESIEAINSSRDDDVGYTGHVLDTDTGLNYMQARYYDPVIGRFYSNDPVDVMGHMATGDYVHGFNRYRYGKNNPYKYVDPDGKIDILANFANLSKNNEASNRVSSIQKTMSKKGVETTDKVIKTSVDVMQTAAELSPQGKASKAIMAVTTVAVSALKAQGTDDPSKSFGIDMAVEAISLGVSKKVDSLLELTGLDDATKNVVSSTIKDSATNTFRDAIDDK